MILRGTALHRGGPAEVVLSRRRGGIVLAQRSAEATLEELAPVRTDRGVTVATRDGRVRIDLVEHLFAAIGGLGITGGLQIQTNDDELPLLDGGALRFAEALTTLDLPRGSPPLRIARDATMTHGGSTYLFSPTRERRLSVRVDFPPPIGKEEACWSGDADDFISRIAPARTFGWMRDLDALLASGRAAGADLASVLVLDDRGAVPGCAPPGPSEIARHKLLDLIGDLTLHGGPPIGSIEAYLPGHTATHAIVARALAEGVIEAL